MNQKLTSRSLYSKFSLAVALVGILSLATFSSETTNPNNSEHKRPSESGTNSASEQVARPANSLDQTATVSEFRGSGKSLFGSPLSVPAAPLPVGDFSISVSPTSRTVNQGGTATYTVTIQSNSGFNSAVSLFALNLPGNQVLPGTGFSPQTVTPPANGSTTSTLTIVTNSQTPTGTFTITVQGQGGGLTRSTNISLTVNAPNFSVSASPSSRTITQGQTTTYTVTVNSLNGFSGSVSLFALNLPGNVVLSGTGFSPQTVNVPSGGSASSTFTYVSNTSVPTGTFTVTMQGQGGGLTRSTTVSLTINSSADFTVSASPSSRTITQGQTTTYTVTVSSFNGFSGSVSLFALNLPGNVVLSGTGFSPQTVNVSSGGSASSTFTYVSNTSVPTGTFTVTMQGQGGGLTRSTTVSLTVNSAADFSVSASPSSRTISQGQTTTYTITVNSINGFSGSVSLFALNLPGNVVLAGTGFSPQTVNVPSGGSASSTFTYVSNTTVPTGTSTVTMQGQGSGLTRSTSVSLTVNASADFTLNASPSSRTITQGQTTTYTVTVNSVNGFSGSVSLFALNLPGNVVLAGTGFSPQTVNVPSGGSASSTFTYVSNTTVPTGTFTVTMQGQGGGLTRSTTVMLAVNSNAPSINNISPSTVSPGSFSLTINGTNFDPSTGQIVVTGSNCPTTSSCVVPNNVLTTKTSGQLVGPVTINVTGTFTIQVQNGSGGALSNGVTLIVGAPMAPTISSVSPSMPQVGASDQNVSVLGTNFDQNLTATITFPNGGTTTLTGTQIQNVTAASFVMRVTFGSAGTWRIRVNNPNGSQSNVFTFTVQGPALAPAISSINPVVPVTASSDQNVSVYGYNFQSNLTISVTFPAGGGTTLTGSQILNVTSSSFMMRITLGVPGTWRIRVNNPDGNQSTTFSFGVISSSTVPTIQAVNATTSSANVQKGLSAANASVSTSAQNLTVSGLNFQPALGVEVLFPNTQGIILQGPTQVQNVTPSSFLLVTSLPASGDYTLRVRNPDGGQSPPFTYTVPPSTPGTCSMNVLTRFSQIEGGWENDVYDHYDCTTTTKCRIKNWGCYTTSVAMALKFNGIDTDPHRLNEFMKTTTPSGYTGGGLVQNLNHVVSSLSGGNLKFIATRTSNTQTVKDILCNGFPLIVGVSPSLDDKGVARYGHFVLVTGIQGNTFSIVDPMQGINESRTLDFYFKSNFPTNWFETRGYVAPSTPPSAATVNHLLSKELSTTNTSSIVEGAVSFSVGHNAELLLIDPLGRRTGFDPITATVLQEIQNSAYFRDALNEDETGTVGILTTRALNVAQPLIGRYQLIVTSQGSGTAEISMTPISPGGVPQPTISIISVTQTGSTSTYDINIAAAVTGAPILATEGNSIKAIALDSVTMRSDPFSVTTTTNFSADQRTRIMLFGTNLDWQVGASPPAVTAVAKDAQQVSFPLTVESVMKVPNMNSLTQIVVKLPDELIGKGDVQVTITVGGVSSQPVTVRIQ